MTKTKKAPPSTYDREMQNPKFRKQFLKEYSELAVSPS